MPYRDPVKKAAARKRWKQAHPEAVRAEKMRWYRKYQEREKKRKKEWNATHPRTRTYTPYDPWPRSRLTESDWWQVWLVEQGESCATCGLTEFSKVPHLDHDHGTGELRDLLCSDCNLRLGYFEFFERNPAWVTAFKTYLENHGSRPSSSSFSR